MATQTGRTVSKWMGFRIDDSGGTIREIPVTSVGGVGVVYDETEQMALQDVLHGFLNGHGTVSLSISGPFDSSAAQSASTSGNAPALSGSHTVLAGVNGADTPLAFAIYFGVRHYWEAGEPVFGLAASSANGILVTGYQVDPASMTYSAELRMYPGSAAPAWGTSAIT